MTKVTLATVGSLIDATTAQTTINDNSAAIVTAVENTLSRDGTSPNQMGASLDMNSHQILNLPAPATGTSPLRLTDASTLNGGGTIATIPTGGTTGQVLKKASNADFDLTYGNNVSSVNVVFPAGIDAAGGPITSSGTITGTWSGGTTGTGANVFSTSPALVTPALGTPSAIVLTNATGLPITTGVSGLGTNVASFLATPSSANLASALTDETGTGANVFATSPTLVTPLLGTPTSGTLTNCTGLPVSTGISGLGSGIATFLATPSSANLATAVTGETGTGALVFATTPTLVTPVLGVATATSINGSTVSPGHYTGEPSTGSASAGEIGEYVESVVTSGSAVALTTNVAKTVTSISLTAGDWDVDATCCFSNAATTSFTVISASLSNTTDTSSSTPGRFFQFIMNATVPGSAPLTAGINPYRFSLSSTTTIYLVAFATFTVSTAGGFGLLRARRIR